MSVILLIVLGALMHAARSFAPDAGFSGTPAGVTVAFGYLLLSAFLAGKIFQWAHLPRLTGYLVTGLVVGPGVLDLISEPTLVSLRIFNGVAIALIALTAGSEMEFRSLRPQLRAIRWITLIAVLGTSVALAAAAYFMRQWLPFMLPLSTAGQLSVAGVLGVTMVAQSPAVAVALRDEMDADGPLTRTVLGVVVLADIVVIVLFAVMSSVAHAVFGGGAEVSATASALGSEILGSALAGIVIGLLVALFLKKVTRGGALFILAVGFVVAEVGQRIHLDPLLIALATGMFIRNATRRGDRLLAEIETGSLPIYVGFFAVAGATIHLDVLQVVGLPAILFVLLRGLSFLGGSRVATRLARAPEPVQRFAGFGLLPQAGLALALALLLRRTFPSFGEAASTLVFGVVAINELVAPVLYRFALAASGEAGQLVRPLPAPDESVASTATGASAD